MTAHDKGEWIDEPPTADAADPSSASGGGGDAPDEEAANPAASPAGVGVEGGEPTAEVAEYREALLRVKADFDNYRKRVAKDQAATVERAAEKLVTDLLPVLDACEAALGHGADDVEPIHKSLLDVLEKGGLERMAPEGQPFDPNLHDAVLHEAGDGGETVVTESLRTGYLWNGRVVRPAMVKVRG